MECEYCGMPMMRETEDGLCSQRCRTEVEEDKQSWMEINFSVEEEDYPPTRRQAS